MKENLTKHTMWLFPGDFRKLGEYYPQLGSSLVVRQLIREHIEKLESQIETDIPKVDVDL